MPLDGSALKTCNKCGEDKLLDQYWKDHRAPSGLVGSCKACASEQRKQYVASNKPAKKRWYENRKAAAKADQVSEITCATCDTTKHVSEFYKNCATKTGYQIYCKVCVQDVWKEKYHTDAQFKVDVIKRATESKRKNVYGVPPERFNEILLEQGNKCAICVRDLDGSTFKMRGNMDHNHQTGKPRGILCAHCNQALGMFQDSIKVLRCAVEYLEKHGSSND